MCGVAVNTAAEQRARELRLLRARPVSSLCQSSEGLSALAGPVQRSRCGLQLNLAQMTPWLQPTPSASTYAGLYLAPAIAQGLVRSLDFISHVF